MLNVQACLERASEFDIIHNHTFFEGLSTAGLVDAPVLTTLHGAISGDWLLLFERYRGWYNTISLSASSVLPVNERFAGVVYNGIDCALYPFNGGERDDYLLFLSRMSEEKGPHLAIELARRLNRRLVLAGNVHGPERGFFQSQVLPHVDGDRVTYVGEADYSLKRRLLFDARCLVAPLTWPEPFGLFMVEAMACGTPVVALNGGAAPEVVRDGVTGYVVETLEEMAEAVRRTGSIHPWACRQHVESNFDFRRMTDDYLKAYKRILDSETQPSPTRPEVAALRAAVPYPQRQPEREAASLN